MAAPTNAAFVKKVLANSEPSTHGPSRRWWRCKITSVIEGLPELATNEAPGRSLTRCGSQHVADGRHLYDTGPGGLAAQRVDQELTLLRTGLRENFTRIIE